MARCGGRPDGGNFPECIQRVRNGDASLPVGPRECGFDCLICLCRCQVAFDESKQYVIAEGINWMKWQNRKAGGDAGKKDPEEKGLMVVSRALVDALENSLLHEHQATNGWSEGELMRLQCPVVHWICSAICTMQSTSAFVGS